MPPLPRRSNRLVIHPLDSVVECIGKPTFLKAKGGNAREGGEHETVRSEVFCKTIL